MKILLLLSFCSYAALSDTCALLFTQYCKNLGTVKRSLTWSLL